MTFAEPVAPSSTPIEVMIAWAISAGLIVTLLVHFIGAKHSLNPRVGGSFMDEFAHYGRHIASSHCTTR
jgi:hypothetical protein